MKSIDIYVAGYYSKQKQLGDAVYYLAYKDAVIKRIITIKNTSSITTLTLYALMHALEKVNEPCNITIHSKQSIGLKKPTQSQNTELVYTILDTITRCGHIINIIDNDKLEVVNKWEAKYSGKNTTSKEKNTKQNKCDRVEIREEDKATTSDWRQMYSDLMGASNDRWVPGSGGY